MTALLHERGSSSHSNLDDEEGVRPADLRQREGQAGTLSSICEYCI
mgnify:FL=1